MTAGRGALHCSAPTRTVNRLREEYQVGGYLMTEAIRHILSTAMLVSPTGIEQDAFTRMHNDMVADGRTQKEIATELVGCIHDGLTKGNWPR